MFRESKEFDKNSVFFFWPQKLLLHVFVVIEIANFLRQYVVEPLAGSNALTNVNTIVLSQ